MHEDGDGERLVVQTHPRYGMFLPGLRDDAVTSREKAFELLNFAVQSRAVQIKEEARSQGSASDASK